LYIPAPCKFLDEEIARDLMVAYVTGRCPPEERLVFEAHCLACDKCLTTLAIIEDMLGSPVSESEEETFAPLAAGSEAARIARGASIKEAPTSASGDDLRKAA
jgi:anti-sigma factor RsiW